MRSPQEVQDKLDKHLKGLSPLQQKFLLLRRTTKTYGEACDQIEVSRQTSSRWKRVPKFMAAYTLAVEVIPDPRRDLMLPPEEREALIATQIESLTAVLPDVVRAHVNIALYGAKDSDRIRAINMLYEVLGVGTSPETAVSKQNRVFLQMLQILGPQVAIEAKKRGMELGATVSETVRTLTGQGLNQPIDAEFTEVEDTEERIET